MLMEFHEAAIHGSQEVDNISTNKQTQVKI